MSCEKERERRILQDVVTHPSINEECVDLKKHMHEFFSQYMRMTDREIDSNFTVSKTGRQHTVTINFSRRLFKGMLYGARNKMRRENPDNVNELYINDNLTHFNFTLLRSLKRERRSRLESQSNSFVSVFSLDGRVYVKTTSNSEKIHIRNTESLENYLCSVNDNRDVSFEENS